MHDSKLRNVQNVLRSKIPCFKLKATFLEVFQAQKICRIIRISTDAFNKIEISSFELRSILNSECFAPPVEFYLKLAKIS